MSEKKKRVTFTVIAPEAEQVFLSGTFNNWSETRDPMKQDETGTWKKIKVLPRGTYEYKFIVDGVWTCDPNCKDIIRNEEGTENNVIVF